jgi:hypothetical protein
VRESFCYFIVYKTFRFLQTSFFYDLHCRLPPLPLPTKKPAADAAKCKGEESNSQVKITNSTFPCSVLKITILLMFPIYCSITTVKCMSRHNSSNYTHKMCVPSWIQSVNGCVEKHFVIRRARLKCTRICVYDEYNGNST